METNRKSLMWVITAFLCVALFFGYSSGNFKITSEAATSATLVRGRDINLALKRFVDSNVSMVTDYDNTIEHVIFMAKGATPNKKLPSKNIGTANNSVTAYYDSEKKTVYIYSAADTIFLNPNCESMFYGYTAVKSIEFNGRINTSKVTNFSDMFGLCKKLEVLDVSKFDTSNATNLSAMFNHCDVLKTIDISNFNTSKVTSMHSMFFECLAVENLDFSKFDTSKVTEFTQMFMGCKELKSLDLSSFNTSNVTDMYSMFGACRNLKSLDLSNFDTSKVTNMMWMFALCDKLEYLNISSFDTSKVTSCKDLLNDATRLTVLDAPKIIKEEIILPGKFGLDNDKDGHADNATEYTELAVKTSGSSDRYIFVGLRMSDETCTISFDSNGGSGSMASKEIGKNTFYILPFCAFTAPEGKEFDKWDKGAPRTGITITGNTIIRAMWKDKAVDETEPSEPSNSEESSEPPVSSDTERTSEQSKREDATSPSVDVAEAPTSVNTEKAENIDPNQKTTKFTKLVACKKRAALTWKKQTKGGIKGYEIQYSTDKNFKKNVKSVTIGKAKTTSKKIKKLKSGKKYYFRIRTFKKSGSDKVYSVWSKTKNIKIK